MSIVSDMLKPQGRLAPGPFLKCGLILTGIGFVLSLLTLTNPVIGAVATFVSLFLIYPWVVIWIKRLHQADMSGWMVLLVVLLYVIAIAVLSIALVMTTMPDFMEITLSGDQAAAQAASAELTARTALPSAIGAAVISIVFLFMGNMVLRSDPAPNRFGPPPAP